MVTGRPSRASCGLLAAMLLVPLLASAQTVVDRIAAIVGDQVITLSDVRAARAFGLVDGGPASAMSSASSMATTAATPGTTGTPGTGTPGTLEVLTDAQLLERLVARELMRGEVERFGAGEPPAADLEARGRLVRARFASSSAFQAALETYGLSEPRFRAWLADDVRIDRYIQQRFGLSAQPTDEEVLQYYLSREREFAVDGRPRPFAEVRELVARRLLESRRQAMVDDWVAGLRRRTAVALKPLD